MEKLTSSEASHMGSVVCDVHYAEHYVVEGALSTSLAAVTWSQNP